MHRHQRGNWLRALVAGICRPGCDDTGPLTIVSSTDEGFIRICTARKTPLTQIHAKNDEPIRPYYRKLPGNRNGSIYFVHDPEIGKKRTTNVIGNRSDRARNPVDGIALDEISAMRSA